MKTNQVAVTLCASLVVLCALAGGCTDSSGVSGTKPGAGGFSKEEKARMTSGPTEDDKKRMQEYMAKHAQQNKPAANVPVNSK